MARLVLGIYSERIDAEDGIDRLRRSGYNPKDISIVMKDKTVAHEVADNTGASVASGTVSGLAAGGVLGALAGLLVSTGVIPGLGAFLIGGPIAAALGLGGTVATTVSGAVTGALAGGILGALTSLGLSHDEAKVYEEGINAGGILVAIPARMGEEDEVRMILEDTHADQVRTIDASETQRSLREESYREDYHAPAVAHDIRKRRED